MWYSKIYKKLKYLDNIPYSLGAERNERSRKQYNHHIGQISEIENGLHIVLETLMIETNIIKEW